MKIEVIEPNGFLHDGGRFDSGDRRTVDDVTGAYFCEMGWAKDMDGKVTTKERKVNRTATLNIHSVKNAQTAGVK